MFKQASRLPGSYNLSQVLSGTSVKTVTICSNVVQCQNTQATIVTAVPMKKWDLYSAVCLERHPVIIQSMQEIELKFHNMLKKIEFENSLKNNHELRADREKKKSTADNQDINIQNIEDLMQTTQDLEDSYEEELQNFKFASTITKFDEQNVTSSIKRKFDKNLLLLVQQKVGDKHYWIPPQGIRIEGETMRQTAERMLQDTCGIELKTKFYGNAPIGFYKYKYPKQLCEQGSYGAKVFYFLAKYIDGTITSDIKYQWLDHEELKKVLPNRMQKSISQFMLFT